MEIKRNMGGEDECFIHSEVFKLSHYAIIRKRSFNLLYESWSILRKPKEEERRGMSFI